MVRAGTGQKAGGIKAAITFPLLLLTGAAWVVVLGGLAAARHGAGESGSTFSLGFGWFVWAWEAFVLFMVLLHLIEAGASGLAVTGTGISVLVGTALVLTIIETSDYNNYKNSAHGLSHVARNGLITAFAGFLALSVANTILLLAVGTDHGRVAETYDAKRSANTGPTGTAATTGAPAPYHGQTDV